MEVHAGKILWGRSVELHNMRYTTVLSDGDSKMYDALVQDNPYGSDHSIHKEECVNHVGKRLGTALRNVVADNAKRKITLGGVGFGRLTQAKITKLQTYYTRAIRSNTTAAEMKRAIYATLNHSFSTDANPTHSLCPKGPKSWCFYNKSLALHKIPKSHKTRIQTQLNKKLLWPHLKPIYMRLTDQKLLSTCLMKGTQNSNESFHHTVWERLPKTHLYSLRRSEFGLLLAVAEFNFGPTYCSHIKQMFKVTDSTVSQKFATKRDVKRLSNSNRREKEKLTNAKSKRRLAAALAYADLEASEGGPAYGPGIAAVPSASKKKTAPKKKTVQKKSAKKLPPWF